MSSITKRLRDGLSTARSVAAWTVTAADTAVFGSAAIGLSLVDPGGRRTYHLGKTWSSMNLALLQSRVTVTGLANVVPDAPYVAMVNHSSHVDIWAVYHALPLQIRWVMKHELRRIPIFGFACDRMGHVYVKRGDTESARRSMQEAAERIAAGTTVVFFPEGTRSKDGQLQKFKTGGFRLALEAGVPVLPVAIRGTAQMLPPGDWHFFPGRIRVDVQPPIPTAGRGQEALSALMEETRVSIAAGLAALDAEAPRT